MDIIRYNHQPDDEEGMAAARAWTAWFLGDPEWADGIVRAYLNPDAARQHLQSKKDADA